MSGSIRESKESLFTYGGETAVNHRVSLYVAGVCACLLILITIVLVCIPQDLYATNPRNDTAAKPPRKPSKANTEPHCTIRVGEAACTVTCENVGVFGDERPPGHIIADELQLLFTNNAFQCSTLWSLVIKNAKISDGILDADWFPEHNEDTLPQLSVLEFQACPELSKIESGALEKFPFGANLRELTLARNFKFKELTVGTTRGLTGLTTLNLRENAIIAFVEEGFLGPFKASLKVLQIQGGFKDELIVAQLIGICQQNFFNKLVLVDLTFNSQGNGLSHLGAHQLSALNQVQSLYLQLSGIEVIDADAFDLVSGTINKLNLADNQLVSLQRGTFDRFQKPLKLFLEGNRWRCDCHLKWLQDMIFQLNALIQIADSPTCFAPSSEIGKNLSSANMSSSCPSPEIHPPLQITCPYLTTESTPTNSTNTTPFTVTEPFNPQTTPAATEPELNCNNYSQNLRPPPQNIFFSTIHFKIAERVNDEGLAVVVVEMGQDGGGGGEKTLVWHREGQEMACLRRVPKEVEVKNLSRGVGYVFCLFEGDEIESPLQCQGLTTLPDWERRAWIMNERMPLWVALFVIISIICALIGAAGVVFAFWQKPTLLAFSSRVIRVRTSKTEALVMPKQHKKATECKVEEPRDDLSIRSDPSYVSVQRASKVSLFAFRFRDWLRKVENGEVTLPPAGTAPPEVKQKPEPSISISTISSDYSQL